MDTAPMNLTDALDCIRVATALGEEVPVQVGQKVWEMRRYTDYGAYTSHVSIHGSHHEALLAGAAAHLDQIQENIGGFNDGIDGLFSSGPWREDEAVAAVKAAWDSIDPEDEAALIAAEKALLAAINHWIADVVENVDPAFIVDHFNDEDTYVVIDWDTVKPAPEIFQFDESALGLFG